MKFQKLNLLVLLTLILGFTFGECGDSVSQTVTEEAANNAKKETLQMEQPSDLGMSQDSLDAKVKQKGVDAYETKKSELQKEAVQALELTTTALKALRKKDKKAALEALEKATGKLEVLLLQDPELGLMPFDVDIQRHDLVADLASIKAIKKAVQKAIKNNYYQLAKRKLDNLASEIQVNTYSLPLKTYPDAMKVAAAFVKEDKLDEAKLVLEKALNTTVLTEKYIPLPIIRAEVLIEEATKLDAKKEDKKKEVLQLLDNAEYQLILAEELGYGKRDKEYKELNLAIDKIKKSVESNGDSQGFFKDLKEKLAKFKKRIVA
ncbi:MAG TPA: YfdX family protein [Phaeodactylibacter sp.]|nr:YfdX family protein [Phaeodactylibacter sp.]